MLFKSPVDEFVLHSYDRWCRQSLQMHHRFNGMEVTPLWCSDALANVKSLLELETKWVFNRQSSKQRAWKAEWKKKVCSPFCGNESSDSPARLRQYSAAQCHLYSDSPENCISLHLIFFLGWGHDKCWVVLGWFVLWSSLQTIPNANLDHHNGTALLEIT